MVEIRLKSADLKSYWTKRKAESPMMVLVRKRIWSGWRFCFGFYLIIIVKPVAGLWWVDKPVDIDAIIVGHQWCIIEYGGQ